MPIALFSRKQTSKLPDELICQILSYLDVASLYKLCRPLGNLALSDAVLGRKLTILSPQEILMLVRLLNAAGILHH